MKKILSLLLTTLMIISTMTVSFAQDGDVAGFEVISPAVNEGIYQDEILNLSCKAPGAHSVTFTVGGTPIVGTQGADDVFTASVPASNLAIGAVAVETEATAENGSQLAYDKRYVRIVGGIGATSVGVSDYDKIDYMYGNSADNTNANICKVYVNKKANAKESEYPWMVFQNDNAVSNAYIDFANGMYFSGKFRISFDIMTATEMDNIELGFYGNTKTYSANNSSSGKEFYVAYPALFGTNGMIHTSGVKYNEDTWYSVTVTIDLNESKKTLSVFDTTENKEIVSMEESIVKDFKCMGGMRLTLKQTKGAERVNPTPTGAHAKGTTDDSAEWDEKVKNCGYAAMKIENNKIKSLSGLSEKSVAYDTTEITDRIIPNTAETLTVTLTNPILNADNAELWVGNEKITDAAISASDPVVYVHSSGKTQYYKKLSVTLPENLTPGSELKLKVLKGTSYLYCIKTATSSTTLYPTTTSYDITIPVIVGDENGFYAKLETPTAVSAVLTTANGGEAVKVKLIIAVYDSANKNELKSIETITRTLDGENLYRLTNSDLKDGTYSRVFLWENDTLTPIKTLDGSAVN